MSTTFLGLIAAATVVMAIVQIGLVFYVVRLAKRLEVLSTQVEREIRPLAERLTRVADTLQQATNLAAVQVERVDRLLSGATRRADETLSLVHGAIVGPIREGMALFAALRGVIGALRSLKSGSGRSAPRFDDEDPLFIG